MSAEFISGPFKLDSLLQYSSAPFRLDSSRAIEKSTQFKSLRAAGFLP